MEVLAGVIIGLVIGFVLSGKPFPTIAPTITIKHEHSPVTFTQVPETDPNSEEQPDAITMNGVVQLVQEMLGVDHER